MGTDLLVDTQAFWRAMCNPGFRRVDAYTGVIGSTTYRTLDPPEHVEGFIEGALDSVVTALSLDELRKPLGFQWPWRINGRHA